jgi:ribosomal protein S18 acetylase RimI-like enzyme
MQPILRVADTADIEEVLALWRRADAVPSHTDDAACLLRLIDADADALILAEEGGAIVGTVIAGWDGWRGSIYRLAVLPTHRRRGMGRQLLERAEERLFRAGGRRLQAIVVEGDDQAVVFWRTSGWEEQVERLRFVKG